MKLMGLSKRKSNLHKKTLTKFFHSAKKQLKTNDALPKIYAGDWQFTDENNYRVHYLHIDSDLGISLDGRALPGSVLKVSEAELVYLDTYGYHLRVDAIDHQPISVYDEADNRVYQLSPQTNLE